MPHTQESPAALGRSLRFAAEVARMTSADIALELTGDITPEDRAEVAYRLQVSLDGLHRLLRQAEPMAGQLPDSGAAVRFAAEVAWLTLDRVALLELAELDGESLLELADLLQNSLCGLHRLLRVDRPESVGMVRLDLRFGAVVAQLALRHALNLHGLLLQLTRRRAPSMETPAGRADRADRATCEALADRLQTVLCGLYELLRKASERESALELPAAGQALRFAAAVAGMTLDRVPLLRGEMDDSRAAIAEHLVTCVAGLHHVLRDATAAAFNELGRPRAALSGIDADRPTLRDPLQGLAAVG